MLSCDHCLICFQLCIAVPCHIFKLWAFSGIMFQVKDLPTSLPDSFNFFPLKLLTSLAYSFILVFFQTEFFFSLCLLRSKANKRCKLWWRYFWLRFPWSWLQNTCKISSETQWYVYLSKVPFYLYFYFTVLTDFRATT